MGTYSGGKSPTPEGGMMRVPRAALIGFVALSAMLWPAVAPVSAAGAASIDSFAPASGPVGQSVVITGRGFAEASDVQFSATSAGFTVDDDTQISATAPDGAITGPISVTTPDGTAVSADD